MSLGSIRIGNRYSKKNRLDNRVDLIDNDLTYDEILAAEEKVWEAFSKQLEEIHNKRCSCNVSDDRDYEYFDIQNDWVWMNYERSIRTMFKSDNRLAVELIERRSDIYTRSLSC